MREKPALCGVCESTWEAQRLVTLPQRCSRNFSQGRLIDKTWLGSQRQASGMGAIYLGTWVPGYLGTYPTCI